MTLRFCAGWVCLVTILATTAVVSAGVITLSDGSRLVGTVDGLVDGKIKITTGFAGTLDIDMAQVVSIQTDKPVNVGRNGYEPPILGTVGWDAEQDQAVVQTEEGEVAVPLDDFEAIWPENGKSPKQLAEEAKIEAARPKWAFKGEFGAVAQEGNTEKTTARGGLELRRTTPKNTWRFWTAGDYGEENEIRSRAEVKAGIDYEHNFTERWFGFLKTEAEYDEFENLDLRWINTGGLGYYWIRKENIELKNRVGPGYLYEKFRDGRREDGMILDVGLDFRWDIAKWLTFANNSTYYPTFEDLQDYRLVSDSFFEVPLSGTGNWRLKIGALYEYDAFPDPGRERLDKTYYTNMVFDIK